MIEFKVKSYANEYSLVWRLFPRRIMKRSVGRIFFKEDGFSRGILIKRVHWGETWYHRPSDYIKLRGFVTGESRL